MFLHSLTSSNSSQRNVYNTNTDFVWKMTLRDCNLYVRVERKGVNSNIVKFGKQVLTTCLFFNRKFVYLL